MPRQNKRAKMTASDHNALSLIAMPPPDMEEVIKRWNIGSIIAATRRWSFWRRPDQNIPEGDWRIWLVMAGRGFGKTRMGAEWVREIAENNPQARIALVGATLNEARSIMVEGESGLLNLPGGNDIIWEPSLRKLSWPNGAVATLYSAAEPDSFRGPQHHYAWADEIAKWPHGVATWDNLMLGLRLGERPRIMVTTTPRPVALVLRLVAEADDTARRVVITRGSSTANRACLPPEFLSDIVAAYGGTRLGRQELDGELIADVEGALWTRDLIENCRVKSLPEMRRVVIGVDPPAGTKGDACGIIAVGKGADDQAYVLGDHSVSGRSPQGWANAVATAVEIWNADRVIAEGNQGGAMVETTLRAADMAMPVKMVHASIGKSARAEPVAALYEVGRVHHAGAFAELEDELCGLIAGGGYEGPGRSPDRADALVWAISELMLGRTRNGPRVRVL